MVATLDRAALHATRAHQQARLAELLEERAQVCGCWQCNDEPLGVELDIQIRHVQAKVDHATNQLCERP